MKDKCVSVVGLGKLGLPLAVSFAHQCFDVVGVDIDEKVVELVNKGLPHIFEPHLDIMLAEVAGDKFHATTNLSEALDNADVTIILVPTPSSVDGSFTSKYVVEVCKFLGELLRERDEYHVVVVSSTVMPGSCDGEIRQALELASGRKVGENLGLCYCPEFAALGNVIRGFLEPDFVLVGCSDDHAGGVVANMYKQFLMNGAPIERTTLINAEIAKIALNCYVTTKITFANQMAVLCEEIPGADVDEVTGVIGCDSRIGRKYLTGSTAFGGNCFPRDVRALATLAQSVHVRATLPVILGQLNTSMNKRLVGKVYEEIMSLEDSDGYVIGILGLAFKPNTDVTGESVGLFLMDTFKDKAVGYDPLAVVEQSVSSAQECIDQANIIVVTTMCPEFHNDLVNYPPGKIVIDCWRYLDGEKLESEGVKYVPIGVGPKI